MSWETQRRETTWSGEKWRLEIGDGDLYSRIGLRESKRGIEQLGFFESVQILQERDENDENKLNLNIKVKEKPTGQLQAAIGFNPGSENSSWFGQGTYKEENQSGKGWKTSITGKTDGDDNNSLDLSFRDPPRERFLLVTRSRSWIFNVF